MTTLEVVEAVQRSLENEGFLQSIRAQLRSNVLRIISSGPDYSSKVGKSTALTQSRHGSIAIQLIKDIMEEHDLKESLAVFEAEVGFDNQNVVDRKSLRNELNIAYQQNGSVLECLVGDILSRQLGAGLHDDNRIHDISRDQPRTEGFSTNNSYGGESVEDIKSASEDSEDDADGNYSQIEDTDQISVANSNTTSPAKIVTSHGNAKTFGSGSFDTKSPPKIHSSFHQQSGNKFDESSSFEADSPIRGPTAAQKFTATVLEESFAEEPEQDQSVEEEMGEDVTMRLDGVPKDVQNRGVGSVDNGPEYESDYDVDADKHEDTPKDFASIPVAHSSSLRPAVVGDFDPIDRNNTERSLIESNNPLNRVSVRRATGDVAEDKNLGDAKPGSKANVLRLGQSSISRSQLGWGSDANTSVVDDRVDDEGNFDAAPKGNVSRVSAGAPRYSTASQMEAVSFDSDEDEHQPSPARGEQRRSTNQESESEDDSSEPSRARESVSDASQRSDEFEMENRSDDNSDVSFGDEDGALPSMGRDTQVRSTFSSAPTIQTEMQRQTGDVDSEVDEYGDDDFVEDEEDAEEKSTVPAKLAAPTASLFTSRPTNSLDRGVDEEEGEEDQQSVEEEIEEEEIDDMSIGNADSEDEDGGFGSPAVPNKEKTKPSEIIASSGSMFRVGRSGALPGVRNTTRSANFDSMLNSFEADSDEDDGGFSNYLPSSNSAVGKVPTPNTASSISSRMREIDSQLEKLENSDPHLVNLRDQDDDNNSVASEDIDAMEFSTGGGPEDGSESSGEGSFSFLDASSKK